MRAVFLASRQPESVIEQWTSSLQAAGASVSHVALWSGPGEAGLRQNGRACIADAFLLGPAATVESHLAEYASGEDLLLVSVDPEQQLLPRSGAVLLVWQPQVPQDIVQACMTLPPCLADGFSVRGLLLLDASPSLTLSVTHKALESAGLQSIARKPTVLLARAGHTAQASLQALQQLAEPLPPMPTPQPDPSRLVAGVRIAVARDDAFGPCFQENLVLLHQAGAQLLFFSPLYDTGIPPGVACVYLSSGPLEPERWQQLANNRPLLAALRAFCEAGGLVLAEGSGMLCLSRTVALNEDDGPHKQRVHEMAGVLPFKAQLLPEPHTAAVQLHVSAGNPLLPADSQPRGYLCSQAGLVLVEERPLHSLGFGLPGKGGGLFGGKGGCSSAALTTTYEVTLAAPASPRAAVTGRAASGKAAVLPGEEAATAAPAEAAGLDVVKSEEHSAAASRMPEGYTTQNVLASSCFMYLPSEPAAAAHWVRRCACIDVGALAAGMAHHMGAIGGGAKSQLGSNAGSRAVSRRQSIQELSALGAAYGSNGNGSGNGMLGGGPMGCGAVASQNHHHHHHQYLVQGGPVFPPPRGPSCASLDVSSTCSGGTGYGPSGLPSPRQPSCKLAHSSSAIALAQLSKSSGVCGVADAPLQGGQKQQLVSSCQPVGLQVLPPPSSLPPLHPCRANMSPAGWRNSHDYVSGPPSAVARQSSPFQQSRCATPPPYEKTAPQSPCSTVSAFGTTAAVIPQASTISGCEAAAPAEAEAFPAVFDSPLPVHWPRGEAGSRPAFDTSGTALNMERSSSCCNSSSALALAPAGDALLSQGAMQHAASSGSLPSFRNQDAGYAAAERQSSACLLQGAQEDVGASYPPPYGAGGYGWAAPAAPGGGLPCWSPGVPPAASRPQSSMGGPFGCPLGGASSSNPGGHADLVCCAPGPCEALVAMGLANRLVGIGADCDYPADVCASRRVVLSWVAPEEAPQGAAARGIRIVRPCGQGLAAATGGAHGGGGRGSLERPVGRCGGRVLLVDELVLRQEPPSVMVLPDAEELSEVERSQLQQALEETGLADSSGGSSSGACTLLAARCRTLVDVMDLMLELGCVAGEPQAASMLLERLQGRLRRVTAAAAAARAAASRNSPQSASAAAVVTAAAPAVVRGSGVKPPLPVGLPRAACSGPRVLVLQSLQPLVEPGRWVPEILAMAGGSPCLALPGGPSVQLTWQDIRERAAPEVIIILTPPPPPSADASSMRLAGSGAGSGAAAGSAGSSNSNSLQDQLAALAAQPGWWCLPAVRVSQVYLMQASYCVRPGPRLVDGVELLARLLLPGHYSSSRKVPPGAVMRLSLAAGQRCRATMLSSYFVPVTFA